MLLYFTDALEDFDKPGVGKQAVAAEGGGAKVNIVVVESDDCQTHRQVTKSHKLESSK